MFNKTHIENLKYVKDGENVTHDVKLTFVKSVNVQAYPCGRRRSINIAAEGDAEKRLPFDPEARLNTEANNRKHSGLNGYTQTYLKDWDPTNGEFSLAIAGYLFKVTLGPEYMTAKHKTDDNTETDTMAAAINAVGVKIASNLNSSDTANYIYANIVTEEVHLFSTEHEYYTSVLRKQEGISGKPPAEELDLPISDEAKENFDNYYFSGLSFSTTPLVKNTGTRKEEKISVKREVSSGVEVTIQQALASLCILEKINTAAPETTPQYVWKIHEPARLPQIEHDVSSDSIKVGETHVRKNLQVDENVTIGTPDTGDADVRSNGALKAQQILIPYDTVNNSIKGFPNTEIKDSGLYTAYIKAGSIEADGLAVGDAIIITAPDSDDKDNDGDTKESLTLTTVSGDCISTVGYGKIDKYLNVGNPSEGTTTDGAIVAENNITAEQDIIAKNDLVVKNNANIAKGLVVGSLEDSVEDGTLKAIVELEAPLVDATTKITTPNAIISKNLLVQGTKENPAVATIDKATITTAHIEDLTGDDIQQKIVEGSAASYYSVPVIFLEEQTKDDKRFYQLQISRVNNKN